MDIQKMISHCKRCNVLLTDKNDSYEHVIINAVGGRMKVNRVFCKSCNSHFGSTCDSELAAQLQPLSLFCQIRRENGVVPRKKFQTVSGKKIQISNNGHVQYDKPDIQVSEVNGMRQVRYTARTRDEMKQFLNGYKRKNPSLNVNAIIENMVVQESYLDDPVLMKLSFGGKDIHKSLVKSILTLAVKNNIDTNHLINAIKCLNDCDSDLFLGLYYVKDLILNRPLDKIIHCVAINADPNSGLLLGYVEFFSAHKMIICISDTYDGNPVTDIYAIDPVSGTRVDLEIDMALSRNDLSNLNSSDDSSLALMKNALEIPISVTIRNNFYNELKRIAELATDHAFKNCGILEGEMLTGDHIKKMIPLLLEKIMPFVARHSRVSLALTESNNR